MQFVDVNGDSFLSPIDALMVLNRIRTARAEGESLIGSVWQDEDDDDSYDDIALDIAEAYGK